MAVRRYQYLYAVIDPSLGDMCIAVHDTTDDCSDDPNYIPIEDDLNGAYLFKYYDRTSGKWYYNVEHTQEWIPA